MPLKRTYSTSTTIVPSGYQATKKRNIRQTRGAKRYPVNGTVGKPRPFPIRMVVTLRYCETIAVTSSLTTIGNLNIACNSIYDPNLTGTGHQPYGHDTYANIYNQYTVLRSKLKATPTRGTSASGMTYGAGIEDTVTTVGALDAWAERPTYTVIPSQQAYGMMGCKPIIKYWDRAKRFPHEDLYRTVSAPFGANPSEIEVFNIVCQDTSGATSLGTVYWFIEVEYTCELYELKDLGSS